MPLHGAPEMLIVGVTSLCSLAADSCYEEDRLQERSVKAGETSVEAPMAEREGNGSLGRGVVTDGSDRTVGLRFTMIH